MTLYLHTSTKTITRRIGGLENQSSNICHWRYITRRIGGLEKQYAAAYKGKRITRRIGGLENLALRSSVKDGYYPPYRRLRKNL